MLAWGGHGGRGLLPVAFRRGRPKRSCAPHGYRAKTALTAAMLKEAVGAGLRVGFLAFDTRYTADWLTKLVTRREPT